MHRDLLYFRKNRHIYVKILWSLTLKTKIRNGYMKPHIMVALICISGYMIGMILAFCFGKNSIETEAEWMDSIILYLRYGTIYYNDLLFYILKKRISAICILILICMTDYAAYILLAGVGIFGILSGYMISKCVILKGIMGSVFFAVSLFPHFLCYIYGYLKLLEILKNKKSKKKSINQTSQSYASFQWKKIFPIVVVIIGLLLECYVNPFFVKIFLKFFM